MIIDTSILCVWLRVPDMSPCGPQDNQWDYERVNAKIEEERQLGTLFVLPLAVIIETGNHITQARGDIYTLVNEFADFIIQSADGTIPWATFTAQSSLWNVDGIKSLAQRWRATGITRQSIGDASIVDVAEYYAEAGNDVEILTADEGLRSYQPISSIRVPRRRK